MKLYLLAALVSVAAAGPVYLRDSYASPPAIIVPASNERHQGVPINNWSSDWNTRLLEPNAKKQSSDYATNAARGDGYSNTRSANQGIYQLTPDGRFALTWTADDSGFQPKGDHLPTPPPMPEDRSVQTSTGIKRLLESNAQKHLPGYGIHPAHGYSHSNTRSTNHDGIYWISPEGRRFTLTWVPDDRPSVQASSGEEWDLPIPDVHPPATDALPNWELDHYYDH